MTTISILGCGWLGFPLGQALVKAGYEIKGSTTSDSKKELLESAGIRHFSIALEVESVPHTVIEFLAGSDILIIAIPPNLSRKNKNLNDEKNDSFVRKIENLVPFVEQSSVQKLIFISSTSLYAESELNPIITEDTIPNPLTESGKQLLQIENLLSNNKQFKTTILRFGGLIGPERNPARFMAGKEKIANPEGAINLIHLEDCIDIIKAIIAKDVWGERFNAVAPNHPSRMEYYTRKALEENRIPPTFNHDSPSMGKLINSDKLRKYLDYIFARLDL